MAEKRYIEFNELINDLNKFAPEAFNALINNIICNQPAADVQEVRHGKWIYISRSPEWADCKCSECGYTDLFPNNMECFYNYCPECGAKMDKE